MAHDEQCNFLLSIAITAVGQVFEIKEENARNSWYGQRWVGTRVFVSEVK